MSGSLFTPVGYRDRVPGAGIMDLHSALATPPASTAVAAAPTPSPTLTGKYRRNGKLQSCEPCRKSKLRCDHTVPVCARCIKRRCVDQCVYHPNPLTQPRKTSTPGPTIPTPTASCATTHSSPCEVVQSIEQPVERYAASYLDRSGERYTDRPISAYRRPVAQTPLPRVADAVTHAPAHRAASAPPVDVRIHESAVRGQQSQSFFGATSYPSIFSEGLGHVDVVAEPTTRRSLAISQDRIARGVEVLRFFKKKHMLNTLVSRYYQVFEESVAVCIEAIMKQWMMRLWVHHGDTLTSQKPEKLRQLSELIWKNTQTPLAFDGNTTALDYARMATGHFLRWEVVGLIATNAGLYAMSVDASDDTLASQGTTRRQVMVEMEGIADTCLKFCRDIDAIDDMYSWLLAEHVGLVAALKGDTSFASYRGGGEIVDFVVARGLHLGSKPCAATPFFLSELRNRLACAVYAGEIAMSVFLGRPARLSYRHCTFILPLDLSDGQLALEGSALDAALAELDENGDKTTGRVSRMSYMRACFPLYQRREEILDLALANYGSDEVLARADKIMREMEEHVATLPLSVAKYTNEAIDWGKLRPIDLLMRSALKQCVRANELLLQRVLIRKTGAGSKKLIEVAQATFTDILLLTQRHDVSSLFRSDVTMILIVHGLRCAATLAVELLKQEQRHNSPEQPLLPRSQTIQDLSIFASRLGATDPSDGSYSICQQGRKLVTGILDKILAPKAPSPPLYSAQQQQQQQQQQQLQQPLPPSGHVCLDPALALPVQRDANMDVQMTGEGEAFNFLPFDSSLRLGNDMDFMQWLQNADMEQAPVWNTL